MHFISGLPWIPNLGVQIGLTTDYLLFCTNKQNDNANNRANIPFSKQCHKRVEESIEMLNPSLQRDITNNAPISFSC